MRLENSYYNRINRWKNLPNRVMKTCLIMICRMKQHFTRMNSNYYVQTVHIFMWAWYLWCLARREESAYCRYGFKRAGNGLECTLESRINREWVKNYPNVTTYPCGFDKSVYLAVALIRFVRCNETCLFHNLCASCHNGKSPTRICLHQVYHRRWIRVAE